MRSKALILILLLSASAQAQRGSHDDSLQFNQLVKKLRPLSRKLATFQWFDDDASGNAEKRFEKIEKAFYPSFLKLLENPLSFSFNFKGFGNVMKDVSPDGKLHVINAGYATGGTSTYMGTNYIQYVRNDSVCVTQIGEDFGKVRSTGVTIYLLKTPMHDTTVYLLLGEAKGNTSYGIWEAIIYGVGPRGLIENYPAFPNRSNYMCIDMNCEYGEEKFSFNKNKQVLTITLTDCDNAQSEIMDSLHLYHSKDNREDISDYGDWTTKLKFTGQRFLVMRHPIHKHED